MFICDKKIKFNFEGADFILQDFRVQILSSVYPMHSHSENSFEIHYFPHGRGSMIIDDSSYPLNDKTLIVTGPLVNHEQRPIGEIEKISLYLTVSKNTPTDLLNIFLNKAYFVGIDKTELSFIINKIYEEFNNKSIGYITNIQNYIKLLLLGIIREYNERITLKDESKPDDLIFYLESVFLNEFRTITLEELANRCFMSTRQLQRFLGKNYKKNFIELKVDARMNFAVSLLENKDISIEEISNLSGYSTREHFSCAFKKRYNMSPLKYRQKHLMN